MKTRQAEHGDDRPVVFFAGVWTPWTSVRKIKEGEVTSDLYRVLTTEANADMATHQSKATCVILTDPAKWDLRMNEASRTKVQAPQRRLPAGVLKVVATYTKRDKG